MRFAAIAWVLVVPVLACSSSGKGGDDGSGSSGTGESGESGGLACEEYESADAFGPAVTITVAEASSSRFWFQPIGCGGSLPIVIRDANDQTFGWRIGECSPIFCDEFLGAQDCTVGCNDCAPPSDGSIEPDAMRDTEWSGVMHVPLQMSAACAPGTDCQSECLRRDQAPDGAYTVEITVYTTCTGNCDCQNENQGICLNWDGGAELSDPITITAPLAYPTQTSVTLELMP